jgi:hypothetical protein
MMSLVKGITQTIHSLTVKELLDLDGIIHRRLKELEAQRSLAVKTIIEERKVGEATYRMEYVRCGKSPCQCVAEPCHGPYWYAYSRINGTLKKRYIGKKLPEQGL